MNPYLGVISGIICLVAYIPYARDTLSGHTKPARMSWFIWSLLGIIALITQLLEGASLSLGLTMALTTGGLIIFILSLRYGVGGVTRHDKIALIVTISSLLVWYITARPATALYMGILIGTVGATLTAVKAYKFPYSETFITWLLASVSALLTLASFSVFDPVLIAYPLYIFVTNSSIVLAILLGKRRVNN